MTTERILQCQVAALCVIGTSFIAAGYGSIVFPLVLTFAGIASIVLTDALGWVRLNRWVANSAAVAAMIFSLQNFHRSHDETQLMAIAQLLVYLEVVLLFQEKNSRIYWQIILLSLLQVVIGAALELGLAFGLLLALYAVTAVSAFTYLFVHQSLESEEAFVGSTKSLGRRGFDRPPELSFDCSRADLERDYLRRPLFGTMLSLCCALFLFAALFFYSVPRNASVSAAPNRRLSAATEAGTMREMTLQQMGKLKQTETPVMRVYIDKPDGTPYQLSSAPYFAAEALTNYRGRYSTWSTTWIGQTANVLLRTGENEVTAVQHFLMEPGDDEVYSMLPAFRMAGRGSPSELRTRTPAGTLMLDKGTSQILETWELVIGTSAIQQGNHAAITPVSVEPVRSHNEFSIFGDYLEECEYFDESRFPGTAALAREIIAERNLARRDPILVARTLEDHFITSGLYRYTLDMNQARKPELDPIEDFTVNHRAGHCQYFASSLVMMLRSQGIPARLVIGYRGDEYSTRTQSYQVRQRHAHAWVEAFLRPQEVPEFEVVGGRRSEKGAWLRLDPTPADESKPKSDEGTWLGTARGWFDQGERLWNEYVVGLGRNRQFEEMRRRHREADGVSGKQMKFNREAWAASFELWAGRLGIHFRDGLRFDSRAALTAMVLCAIGFGCARFAKALLPRLIQWTRRRISRQRKLGPFVRFYVRLEAILARRGARRAHYETAAEFARSAAETFESIPHGPEYIAAIKHVVHRFEQVRFGGADLSPEEFAAIEESLARLERAPRAMSP